MLKFLPLVLKNSVRSRRRSVLTILSITASLCLLGILGAFYHMFFLADQTEQQALRLVVRNRVSLARPLPLYYGQEIASVPGVREVMVFQWFNGTYRDARDPNNFFPRYAVEAEKLAAVYPEYRLDPEQREAFLRERTACIVGRKLAERLGFSIGDHIVLQGDIYPVDLDLTVRGIYDSERDNENLIFHNDYLREAMAGEGMGDFAGTFVIRAESPGDTPRIAQTVDEMYRNATMQTKTETEKQFEVSFLAFLGNVKLYLLSICGAITFTILLVSGNTMAMSIRERVHEVGILKTLGFPQGTILALMVSEAVAMSLVGGVLGLVLANAACAVLRSAPSTYVDMSRVVLPASMWSICLAVAAMIGILGSAVPAWNASRRPIVEALRFSD